MLLLTLVNLAALAVQSPWQRRSVSDEARPLPSVSSSDPRSRLLRRAEHAREAGQWSDALAMLQVLEVKDPSFEVDRVREAALRLKAALEIQKSLNASEESLKAGRVSEALASLRGAKSAEPILAARRALLQETIDEASELAQQAGVPLEVYVERTQTAKKMLRDAFRQSNSILGARESVGDGGTAGGGMPGAKLEVEAHEAEEPAPASDAGLRRTGIGRRTGLWRSEVEFIAGRHEPAKARERCVDEAAARQGPEELAERELRAHLSAATIAKEKVERRWVGRDLYEITVGTLHPPPTPEHWYRRVSLRQVSAQETITEVETRQSLNQKLRLVEVRRITHRWVRADCPTPTDENSPLPGNPRGDDESRVRTGGPKPRPGHPSFSAPPERR